MINTRDFGGRVGVLGWAIYNVASNELGFRMSVFVVSFFFFLSFFLSFWVHIVLGYFILSSSSVYFAPLVSGYFGTASFIWSLFFLFLFPPGWC